MRLVAVPDRAEWWSDRFGFADIVLHSLEEFDESMIERLASGEPIPSLARPRFHLAFPVDDLEQARSFYGDLLGCREGRSATEWVDFDFFGHQIVAHLDPGAGRRSATNEVDGHPSPTNHFGALLHTRAWEELVAKLEGAGVEFLMRPTARFVGQPGEHRTCFVIDPAGNALEFKAFADDRATFAVD